MEKSIDKKRPRDEEVDQAAIKKQKVKDVVNTPQKEKKEKKDMKRKTLSFSPIPEPGPVQEKDAIISLSGSEYEANDNYTLGDAKQQTLPISEPTAITTDLAMVNSEDSFTLPSIELATANTPSFSSAVFAPKDAPESPEFPLYTQTVSLRTTLYPSGFSTPVAAAKEQLLKPLLGKYSSLYRGILLNYYNVVVSETPDRSGCTQEIPRPVKVQSRDEFAVGFTWVTADLDLFMPRPGAWMKGRIVLQTEGHIGVVCFSKFNASIEAPRLPPSWRWVAGSSSDDMDESSGHFVDGAGTPIGGSLLFRTTRFDVGVRDDHSFISIEGTMLSDEQERKITEAERRREERRWEKASGYLRATRKSAPEGAVTTVGEEVEVIRDIRGQIDWRRVREVTPKSYVMVQ